MEGDTTLLSAHPSLPVLNPTVPEEDEANKKPNGSSNDVSEVADRVHLLLSSGLDAQQIHCQDT